MSEVDVLRTKYAEKRRNSLYANTSRVIWKTRSRHVA